MPAISASFADQAFLPGSGAPALPLFAASDVDSFSASAIVNPIRYELSNPNATSEVVPEPSTVLLLGGGLRALAIARRPRLRGPNA